MKPARLLVSALATALLLASQAQATSIVVRGRILTTQGHESAGCSTVALKRDSDQQILFFRIPAGSGMNDILAITLTALTQRLTVDLIYDPAVTTGCGSEPKIQYIDLIAAG